jgi:hypothetical protein
MSYTEDFGNAFWPKNGSSVTTNTTIAPNGTTTADSLIEDGTTGAHRLTPNITTGSIGQITYSVYAKYNGRQYIVLALSEFSGTDRRAWFDIQNGTVGTVNTNLTASITNVGNGWYRCVITIANSTSSNFPYIWLSNADASLIYTGNGTSGAFIWGAQLELGSTATTYQPIATTQQAYIATQFKYNMINPQDDDSAFRLVFNGGWTHSPQGATPNGTNGYADTKLVPSSVLTLNSAHLSFYSRTNSQSSVDIGGQNDNQVPYAQMYLVCRSSLNLLSVAISSTDATRAISSNTSSLGLFLGSRISSTSLKSFKNGVLQTTNTSASQNNQPNFSLLISALQYIPSPIDYSNRQAAFSSIGDGLTDTEAANLYSRVQNLQTLLNRQV